MNRFESLLAAAPVDSSFWLSASSIGMDDPAMFHQFVDSLLGGLREDCIATDPARESQSGNRYFHRVKITRIA